MTTTNSSGSRRARGSSNLRRRLRGAVFACVVGTLFGQPTPVRAQDAADPVVLIVDMQRLQRDSAAAKSIREQSTAIRQAIERAMAEREEAMRAEEKKLAELRENLDTAEFRERVQVFEKTVFEHRDFAQRETAKLQNALSEASNRLRGKIAPILAELMRERRAQVMLDSSQVVLSIGQLEVTDEVIRRLDVIAPTLSLPLSTPLANPPDPKE